MTESQKKLHTQQVSALKKLMSGVIIAEYGLIQLVDSTEKELKRRTKIALTAIKSMQNAFLHSPNISKERPFPSSATRPNNQRRENGGSASA